MSMKTFLAQKSFTETRIFGRPFTFERLIGRFLSALLAQVEAPPRVVVGHPVPFAGSALTTGWLRPACVAPMPKPAGPR